MVSKGNHPQMALIQGVSGPSFHAAHLTGFVGLLIGSRYIRFAMSRPRYVPSTTGETWKSWDQPILFWIVTCVGRTNFLDLFGGWLWSHQQHQFVACYLFWAYRKLMRTRNQWLPFLGRQWSQPGPSLWSGTSTRQDQHRHALSLLFWCGQSRRSRSHGDRMGRLLWQCWSSCATRGWKMLEGTRKDLFPGSTWGPWLWRIVDKTIWFLPTVLLPGKVLCLRLGSLLLGTFVQWDSHAVFCGYGCWRSRALLSKWNRVRQCIWLWFRSRSWC